MSLERRLNDSVPSLFGQVAAEQSSNYDILAGMRLRAGDPSSAWTKFDVRTFSSD